MNGAEQAKQIYNRTLGFLLNDVKNLKCEDLIDSVVSKQQVHLVSNFYVHSPGSFDLFNVSNRKSRSTP